MSSRAVTVDNLRLVFDSFGATAGGLTPEQWGQPSLCPGWAARDVVAHTTTIESALVGWRPGDDNPFEAMPGIARELADLSDQDLLARQELDPVDGQTPQPNLPAIDPADRSTVPSAPAAE